MINLKWEYKTDKNAGSSRKPHKKGQKFKLYGKPCKYDMVDINSIAAQHS